MLKQQKRTTVSMNLNNVQRDVLFYMSNLENRSLTQQVEFIIKRSMEQWLKDKQVDLKKLPKNQMPDFLKQIKSDPLILAK